MSRLMRSVSAAALLLVGATTEGAAQQRVQLLNASYDPTRELYEEFNAAFARHWKAKTGQTVTVRQSLGRAGARRDRRPRGRRGNARPRG
jgi:sulfate transport system substrate-binding protein